MPGPSRSSAIGSVRFVCFSFRIAYQLHISNVSLMSERKRNCLSTKSGDRFFDHLYKMIDSRSRLMSYGGMMGRSL